MSGGRSPTQQKREEQIAHTLQPNAVPETNHQIDKDDNKNKKEQTSPPLDLGVIHEFNQHDKMTIQVCT